MKTMYKAYEWNPEIEEVQVVKDTGRTIHYTVKKLTIGDDLVPTESDALLNRSERKETDWYKYCDTKQEAKAWLLLGAQTVHQDTLYKLQRQEKVIAKILEIKV